MCGGGAALEKCQSSYVGLLNAFIAARHAWPMRRPKVRSVAGRLRSSPTFWPKTTYATINRDNGHKDSSIKTMMMPMLTGVQFGTSCCFRSLTMHLPKISHSDTYMVTPISFLNYRNRSTGTLQERIISVVVEPIMRFRICECP